MIEGWGFNPPPYWPKPPQGWTPPAGWRPDPAWGPVPPGWQLWIPARPAPRRRALPLVGAVAVVLALAALAVVVPRSAGPGAGDPRAAGMAIGAVPLPALAATATATATSAPTSPVPGATPVVTPIPHRAVVRTFRNCAELNRVYPNGVGMPDAVDRTRGRAVTSFGRSSAIYRANLRQDRDGDGIACEPR